MLCQFSVSNFKSFRDEVILNMRSTIIKEHVDSVIKDSDHESFLPMAAIYGPNGGGKSNLCDAFVCMLSTIVLPILTAIGEPENSRTKSLMSLAVTCRSFAFDVNLVDAPSVFAVIVRKDNYEYSYRISVVGKTIAEESLVRTKIGGKRPAIMFYREYDKIDRGATLKNVKEVRIASAIPYLSFLGINYNIPVIDNFLRWFMDTYSYTLRYQSLALLGFESIKPSFIKDMPTSKMSLILSFLEAMDIPISGLEVDEEGHTPQVKSIHTLGNNSTFSLNINDESLGTKKILLLLPVLIDVIEHGGLLIADELDNRIHPKLLEFIIRLFSSHETNPRGAQLIHTSHDVTTMRNDVYRRDEIWFVARDQNGASQLYSLIEFRDEKGIVPRPDAAYNKQYLAGRYGADPYLRTIFRWIGEEDEPKASEEK